MVQIYKGYPHKLNTKLLAEAVDEYAGELYQSKLNVNKVLQFGSYISLGLSELQSRQTKRITRISLGISLLSLLIAGSALYVSYQSSVTSTRWERNQLEILQQLDLKLNMSATKNTIPVKTELDKLGHEKSIKVEEKK